ncbi:MAG: ornithine racemase Orr [Tissierellia bacterium]|nr:ornithine racemase Orr [Tissierellia bacterium]
MYPKLTVNLDVLRNNVKVLNTLLRDNGIDHFAGVTKVFCGNPKIAQAYLDGGVNYLADSRIQNLKRMKDLDAPKILLRLPQISEVDEVVEYADISFNSELLTLEALNQAAKDKGKKHNVVLMVDLGDLREGFYKEEDFYEAVEKVLKMDSLYLKGIGVNLTCYGAVIPTKEILSRLDDYKNGVKEKFGFDLEIISGGNSSSVYLLGKEDLPFINNLRLGEVLILGTESAYGEVIEGTSKETWILEAEIIEIKDKPSVPTGEIGRDAFGNEPTFVDRGIRTRALIALGKQDVANDSIYPVDQDIIVLGGSSDHTILDITDCKKEYKVGDKISFLLDYVGVLMCSTSEYVTKEIK